MRLPDFSPPSLDANPMGPGGASPGRGWRRWLPLSMVLLAGGVYVFLLTRPWNRLFPQRTAHLRLSTPAGDGSWRPLASGAEVGPSASLRLEADSSDEAWAVILRLDPNGKVVRLIPAREDAAAPRVAPPDPVTLGVALLSGRPGPTRFLGVFCHARLSLAVIQKASERALTAAGSPERVQTLDLGCPEASVLLEVAPPR